MTKRRLTKHTFKLGEGQVERLAELHPGLPVSESIRRILDAYIKKAESILEQQSQTKIEVPFDV